MLMSQTDRQTHTHTEYGKPNHYMYKITRNPTYRAKHAENYVQRVHTLLLVL